MNKAHNREYRNKWFRVEEQDQQPEDHLAAVLSSEDMRTIAGSANKATRIIALQSKDLRELLDRGLIEDFRHMELEKMLVDLYAQQGKCERIKNFPYPRQFATANVVFVKIFLLLVPLGMLGEFAKLGGAFIWLTIPFGTLVCWVFNTMEKIGESTENPFEGSVNDVPITAITRTIEIDLREMLGEEKIPPPLVPVKEILM
jgi:putative membrane protein